MDLSETLYSFYQRAHEIIDRVEAMRDERPSLPLRADDWDLVVTSAFGAMSPPPGDGWFLVALGAYGVQATEFSPGENGVVATWARRKAAS